MKISLVNPVTNQIKRAKIGFSWTTFLFGFWPALYRGDWLWFIIMFVTETMLGYRTYAFGSLIVGIVFAFIYNKLYINGLLNKGWVAADAYSNNNPAQTQSSNDDNYQSTSTSTDNQSDDSNSSLDNEDNKVKNQVNSVTDKTDNKSKQDSNSNPSTTTSNANNNSSKNDNNQSNPTNN